MPMMWGPGYGWGNALFMVLGMLIWLGILALLIWAVVRWLAPRTPPAVPRSPSALEILRQRYARGELDDTTFERMRRELEASGTRQEDMAGARH